MLSEGPGRGLPYVVQGIGLPISLRHIEMQVTLVYQTAKCSNCCTHRPKSFSAGCQCCGSFTLQGLLLLIPLRFYTPNTAYSHRFRSPRPVCLRFLKRRLLKPDAQPTVPHKRQIVPSLHGSGSGPISELYISQLHGIPRQGWIAEASWQDYFNIHFSSLRGHILEPIRENVDILVESMLAGINDRPT